MSTLGVMHLQAACEKQPATEGRISSMSSSVLSESLFRVDLRIAASLCKQRSIRMDKQIIFVMIGVNILRKLTYFFESAAV